MIHASGADGGATGARFALPFAAMETSLSATQGWALTVFLLLLIFVLAVWLIAKGFSPSAVRSDDLSATKPAIPALDDRAPVTA